MDKNSIIGFVLIGVVLIGFSWYSQPSQEEQRAQFVKDSTAQANRAKAEKAAKAAAFKKKQETQQKIQEDTTALFYTALTGQAREITLHNDKVELTFSTKGAQVKKAVVKNYRDNITGGKGVVLFRGNDQALATHLPARISTSLRPTFISSRRP